MAIYRVSYRNCFASYGPSFIEADSEYEAKRKFGATGNEMLTTSAREITPDEMRRALRAAEEARHAKD